MQTGIVNSETFSQVLRGISQRRRQGTLEISYAATQVQVLFVQGKIVEVLTMNSSPVAEVVEILKAAELLPKTFVCEEQNYRDLFVKIQNSLEDVIIDEGCFRRVLQHRVLNKLYELDMANKAHYNFKPQMVECDKDFVPNISVGQLLLDLVAIETDSVRFAAQFPAHCRVDRTEVPIVGPSETEQILIEIIKDGIELEILRRRSMLSRYHFQDALLAMLEQKVIEVGIQAKDAPHVKKEDDAALVPEDLVAMLESRMDAVLAGEGFDVDEPTVERGVDAKASSTQRVRPQPATVEQDCSEEEAQAEEYQAETPGLGVKIGVLSAKLLQNRFVPQLIVFIFTAVALLVPYFCWEEIFVKFAQF